VARYAKNTGALTQFAPLTTTPALDEDDKQFRDAKHPLAHGMARRNPVSNTPSEYINMELQNLSDGFRGASRAYNVRLVGYNKVAAEKSNANAAKKKK
jgi:hypothetical protein